MGKQKKVRDSGGYNGPDLTPILNNKEAVCACLKARFDSNQAYTRVGACHMVATSPATLLMEDDQTSLEYVANYKDTSPVSTQTTPPHIYDLVNRTYFYMRRTGMDQAIRICGESGSGKTQIRHLVTRHLVRLSSHKKESKVQTQLINSIQVLDSFGSAPGQYSRAASQYGYYGEIQFNERGRMVGVKTVHYLLDKTNVTGFAIFRQFLAGVTPEQRTALQLEGDFGIRPAAEDGTVFVQQLVPALKAAGFRRDQQTRIWQLLAAIIHLTQLQFVDPTGVNSNQEAAYVRNTDILDLVADLLGVDPRALENVLVFKTAMIRKDVTTLILNADQAGKQRDLLVTDLYGLLFHWMVERLNTKMASEDFASFISILDMPSPRTDDSFHSFTVNVAHERLQAFFAPTQNSEAMLDLLYRPSRGIVSLVRSMAEKKVTKKPDLNHNDLVDSVVKYNNSNALLSVRNAPGTHQRQFAIQHFHHEVLYDPTHFLEANQTDAALSVDFVQLFKGGVGMAPSWNAFLVELWDNVTTESHPRNEQAVVSAQPKLARGPSMRKSLRRKDGENPEDGKQKKGVLAQLEAGLEALVGALQEAKLWSILCVRPNDTQSQAVFDSRAVADQIGWLIPTEIDPYVISYTHQEFLDRYALPLASLGDTQSRLPPRGQIEVMVEQLQWTADDALVETENILLADSAWRPLEDQLRMLEKEEQRRDREETADDVAASVGLPAPQTTYMQDNDHRSYYSEDEYFYQDGSSRYNDESSMYGPGSYTDSKAGETLMLRQRGPPTEMLEKEDLDANEEDESKQSGARKRWLFLVWALTWWIPTKFMIWCGRMKRKDVRIAWREKVALCMLITLLCAFVIWFLVFFGEVVCPYQPVFSDGELQDHSDKDNAWVAIRGEVFDLTTFAPRHYPSGIIPTDSILEYGGTDASDLFPIQVSALCEGVSPYVSLDYNVNLTDKNAQYHDFRYSSESFQPDWYYQMMTMMRQQYKKGNMGYEPKAIYTQATSETQVNGIKTTRKWAIIDGHIYDLTTYDMGGRYTKAPPGETPPGDVNTDFMNNQVVDLFRQNSGSDISEAFHGLSLDATTKQQQLVCLRNLFYVGLVDTRNSAKCQFANYLLLIVTVLLCSVIVFKALAAFRLGGHRAPEELDKFVLCQVTCYTEDEESLRKTINSLATLRYDDKRKLLFIICDGMIVGSGNDRPTPRIVLDILGVDPSVDPEPLSFISVGEGTKQHNMGKIYSGLYEIAGHVVPYLVVVKCGTPSERQKPGNRGKRDSQLILMKFLNRVHFDAPMEPLQLEMFHQMKNVIGVSPVLYEFVLMVDADTEVMPDGLNNLVSSMTHDSRIIGICGETNLSNEKSTWVTMIQVYEYFISHHMIKAFESLFSTVSCLPGCFTMYRIRSVDGKRPLLASSDIIDDYAINKADTLHKKNLLHLGEDRYLTTLLLKHFPTFKTKFTSHAQCLTNAPDTWDVLISQRRRWINSTIHNLGELSFLPRLCGFCCFSMRFVVMLDLITTLVMPAIVGYLGYLIYKLATLENEVPYLTIIVIGATYGLQMVLFIIKRKWEYILWMLVSILAMPVFYVWIPIYSYWHFDDFSWGNTRVVVGEKGKKMAVSADEGHFDPKSIPVMTWSQYEKMLLSEDYYSDAMSQSSHNSSSYASRSRLMYPSDTMSVYTQQQNMYAGSEHPSMMMMSSGSIPMYPMRSSFAPPAPPSQMMMMPDGASSHHSLLLDTSSQGGGPSNEEILEQVKRILGTADLTKVTKKQVREELQAIYGVPMTGRKDYINVCIEDVLQGRV